MKWRTAITKTGSEGPTVRGKSLLRLSQKESFVANTFLILTGELPDKKKEKLLNIMLSLSIDHGVGPVSTAAARIAVSADVSA